MTQSNQKPLGAFTGPENLLDGFIDDVLFKAVKNNVATYEPNIADSIQGTIRMIKTVGKMNRSYVTQEDVETITKKYSNQLGMLNEVRQMQQAGKADAEILEAIKKKY